MTEDGHTVLFHCRQMKRRHFVGEDSDAVAHKPNFKSWQRTMVSKQSCHELSLVSVAYCLLEVDEPLRLR